MKHTVDNAAVRGLARRFSTLSEPAFLFFQMLELLPAGLLQPPTASAQPAATAVLNLETLTNSDARKPQSEDGTQFYMHLQVIFIKATFHFNF